MLLSSWSTKVVLHEQLFRIVLIYLTWALVQSFSSLPPVSFTLSQLPSDWLSPKQDLTAGS